MCTSPVEIFPSYNPNQGVFIYFSFYKITLFHSFSLQPFLGFLCKVYIFELLFIEMIFFFEDECMCINLKDNLNCVI